MDKMVEVDSDLTLISKIQGDHRDEDSLIALMDRHSGLFHAMVNHYMSHPNFTLDKNQIVEDEILTIYDSALNYDPNRNTKFSTHLANQTKWKCLNALNKKRKCKEYFIDDENSYVEPHCESFIPEINKDETMALFQECLKTESDERVKKIVDMRYGSSNNKLTPWRTIAESLDLSIQGCINIHNKFINKAKTEINYV